MFLVYLLKISNTSITCDITLSQENLKLSVPPIWIYIPSDAQYSPPSFGIFKSVCWFEKFVFVLVVAVVVFSKMKTCYVTRGWFTEKVFSRLDNFNSRDPFTYTKMQISTYTYECTDSRTILIPRNMKRTID